MSVFNVLAVVSPVGVGQEIAYMHRINPVCRSCRLLMGCSGGGQDRPRD